MVIYHLGGWRVPTHSGNGRPACAGRRARSNMYVYILKSINHNWFYVGISNNPERRLKDHNYGKSISTKGYKPFILIFKKKFKDRNSARDFEKFLKIRSNKEKLLNKLGY